MTPYIASNIGFGLPAGRFFKVQMTTADGPTFHTKIGGCEFESEARDFAVKRFHNNIMAYRGLARVTVKKCGQYQACFQDTPV